MNQQVNNLELKSHLDQLTKGMSGMVTYLESTVASSLKGMDENQAKEFAKAMKSSDLDSQMDKLKTELNNLKKGFDIV